MVIFLTDATNFIGKNILEELLSKGAKVKVLVDSEKKSWKFFQGFLDKPYYKNLELVHGNAMFPESYSEHLKDVDVVVSLKGTSFRTVYREKVFWKREYEMTKILVDEAVKNKVKKFIYITSLGIPWGAKSKLLSAKYKAEKYVIEFSDNWAIIRSSLVIGPEGEFTRSVFSMLRRGIVLIVGDGKYSIRPISVATISNLVSLVATEKGIDRKELNVVGPKEYVYEEFIDTFASIVGKKKYLKFHLPISTVKLLAKLFGRLSFSPLSLSQMELIEKGGNIYFDVTDKLPVKNIPVEEEIKKLKYR
ncbi:MAG: NAD(P)H-binding protein [Brevinematia bacterium]